ncbi:MAG TPA: SDR family oxidoreductase [Blastocatellia bacterium]|nr:SDR family oxidoreductase [Blastocatellia bacterium]
MNKQKIALVTGANKGIGFEAARQLAKHDMTVLLGARDEHRGEEAAARLRDEKLDVHFIQLEVSDAASIAAAAKTIESRFGKLDILVNNAGVSRDSGTPPSRIDANALQETLATNLNGVIFTTTALLPLLKKSDDARIINVSSTFGSINAVSKMEAVAPAYHISKAALNMWTVMLANELKPQNITVNSICPGWVKTDMGTDAAPRTVEQGAAIITRLATQTERPSGGFFDDAGTIQW